MKASCHLIFILLVLQKLNLTYSLSRKESKKHDFVFKNEDELLLKAGPACNESSTSPIIKLINFIAVHYLSSCMTVILYDEFFYTSLSLQPVITQVLKALPGPLIHGQFSTEVLAVNLLAQTLIKQQETLCTNYIVLTQTLEAVVELLGPQPQSKVVLIPHASQWKIDNFLESPISNQLVNLLIIADPLFQLNSLSDEDELKLDINMYTHKLYATAMGTSVPHVVSAWRCGQLNRPGMNLFPTKITSLNGYQLRVVATEQPPYVYQRNVIDNAGDSESHWDGLEVRLIKLISSQLNYTIKLQHPSQSLESTANSVLADLSAKRADIANAGTYITTATLQQFHPSAVHSHDCAVFMTLTSTALPKYRAIMGPFRWEVWMLVTLAYIFAILPISFSVHHSLRILIDEPYELENMFWYVFGTFTNCFTFSGKKSWSSGSMASTRMFIGTYWAFSIIVSAAYSGSIIAFIMLPIFPEVTETPQQLVEEDFKLVVTNNSDLTQAVYNSTDATIQQLAKRLQIVESVDEGITNVTDPKFFTQYAFLHPREFLKHVIRTKYTLKSSQKKSVFHLSQKCFVPMLVAMMFPKGSVLVDRFDSLLMKASQGGFMNKLVNDVAWDQQRSGTGKLLQVSERSGRGLKSQPPEDKQLTLDDTQGMFLLLGAGFTIAAVALIAECCAFWWQKHFINLTDKLPTIAYPDQGKSIESNQDTFHGQDDFGQYFGSSTNHSVFQSNAMIHVESTQQYQVLHSQSLSVLQPENYEAKKRNPSVSYL